jgi:hypothetical protein
MSVDPYTGSAADINRIRAIEREREEKKKNFEQRKADLKSDSSSGLKKIGSLSLCTRCIFRVQCTACITRASIIFMSLTHRCLSKRPLYSDLSPSSVFC